MASIISEFASSIYAVFYDMLSGALFRFSLYEQRVYDLKHIRDRGLIVPDKSREQETVISQGMLRRYDIQTINYAIHPSCVDLNDNIAGIHIIKGPYTPWLHEVR